MTETQLKSSFGWLELQNFTASPTDTDALRSGLCFVNSSPKYWNGSAWVSFSGGGGISTWDELYSDDKTLAISAETLTFNLTNATANGLTLSASGSATGDVLQFSNAGTGKDVDGTSSTWSVTNLGQAVFARVDLGDNQTIRFGASQNATLQWVSASSYLEIAGNTAVKATYTFTIIGAADTNVFTITDGDVLLSNTKIAITNDDTDAILTMTANSVTTGNAILLTANGITSGSMLALVTTDAGFTTGYYIRCNDGSDVFTVADEGATTIGGAGGVDVLTLTAGDMVLSDGSITVTDADDAASLSVTNNTATSATVFKFAGSGVFTGSTTTSFFTITPSGLTTGTAVYLPVAALTTGKGFHLVGNALTTGNLIAVTSSATAITGNGRLFLSSHSGATGTSAILNEFSSAANDETTIVKITASDVLAAGTALLVAVGSMTTGTAIEITATAITTGKGVSVTGLDALTTGIGLNITSAATAIATTGRMVFVNHTGVSGTSAVLSEFKSAAADETVVFRITATAALAAGVLFDVTGAAVTTGTLIDCSDADALTTGGIMNLTSNSSSASTRTLVTIINDHTSATAVTPLLIRNDAVTATHFQKIMTIGGVTLWTSDGTTANGALTGTAGDICFNAGTNKPEYCTGTTNWTALV